jgi:hypothetical protein
MIRTFYILGFLSILSMTTACGNGKFDAPPIAPIVNNALPSSLRVNSNANAGIDGDTKQHPSQ